MKLKVKGKEIEVPEEALRKAGWISKEQYATDIRGLAGQYKEHYIKLDSLVGDEEEIVKIIEESVVKLLRKENKGLMDIRTYKTFSWIAKAISTHIKEIVRGKE